MPGILGKDILLVLLSMGIKWINTPYHPKVLSMCEDLHLLAFTFITACHKSEFCLVRLFLGRELATLYGTWLRQILPRIWRRRMVSRQRPFGI